MIAEHILNVLDGADNLEELRFTHDYPYGDHSLSILLSLSAAFSNRGSPLKLYVEGDRLDMVLPSVQFHGLKEVNVALSLSYDLWHLKEAVSTFVKHVSPSVEILRFSVPDRDHPGSISLHMTEILRNDALTMPSLRELTTPLMVSPDPMSIFHMMNTKYGSLTKLDLHMNVENLCLDVPLHCLALPHLRILCLKFAPDARIFGLWDGECGLTQLEEFRIKGRYLRLAEVDSMCRFFAPTQLISLSAKVSTLDGSLLRVLANNLPLLRDLDLFALRLVWERCVQTTQTMAHTIAHFEADVKARGLQGWGLKSHREYDLRTTSAMKSFPPELIGNIVEAVDDTPTLLNCLILSRSLSFHAIRALYKSVTLDGERLQAFREAVEANPHYARHIASFSIRHTRSPSRNANIRSIANAAANHNLNYVLSKAPNLRVLKMRLTTWTWADFEASLGPSTQCPWKLTTLVWCDDRSPLELIVAHQGTLEHVQIDRLACQGMAKWGHSFKKLSFPNLRSMRLPYGPRVEPEALGMRKEEWKAAWTTVVEERDGLNMLWSRIR
ncbi:hypothetical protein EYR36_009998 [Pleurotus pulmonarius]|nr:hypothetical protein EYR36_009998 [Pleurotus pulmonarius]